MLKKASWLLFVIATVALLMMGCSPAVAPAETAEDAAEHEGEDDHDDHEGEDDHDDHEGEDDHDDHEGEDDHDDHEGEDDHDDHEGEDDHDDHDHDDHDHDDHEGEDVIELPSVEAVELGAGEKLTVVATTSIIGDVISNVGGDAIDLIVLMGPGQDPHSYEPAARDLTAVAESHIVFVNGWHLEEALEEDLENIAEDVPVVAISANIEPLAFAEDAHGHGEEDGHDEEHGHGEHAFEWAGVFDLEAGEYTWTFAKVDGEYADPAMKMIILETDDSDAHGIEHVEGMAEELLESSDAEVKENGSTLVPAETAYQVTFDESLEVSSFTVSIEEQGYYVFFTEHMPFEFEADEHFFKDAGGEDVEPTAQEPDEGHGHHHHGAFDPHVWFSIHNVEQWVENAEHMLSDLDPANAEVYEANAAAYLAELEALEDYAVEQLSQIPEDNRFLVTNHDAFGYFADEFGFEVLGTVIPSVSTLAEPSASDLVELITEMEEHGVCTVFTETTVSDVLAQTVAGELSGCDDVQVLKLYTGAVGPEGSGAESYTGMYYANVDTFVAGLK